MVVTNKISDWFTAYKIQKMFKWIIEMARQDIPPSSSGLPLLAAVALFCLIALPGCGEKAGSGASLAKPATQSHDTMSTVDMAASASASWDMVAAGAKAEEMDVEDRAFASKPETPNKTTVSQPAAAAQKSETVASQPIPQEPYGTTVSKPKTAEPYGTPASKPIQAAQTDGTSAASKPAQVEQKKQTVASQPAPTAQDDETIVSEPATKEPYGTTANKPATPESYGTTSGKPAATTSSKTGNTNGVPPMPEAPHLVTVDGMNVAEAVGIAISRHPDISRANAIVAQSASQVAIAKAAWYPSIDYGLRPGYGEAYGYQNSQTGLTGSLGATQLLYDFGQTPNQISAAKATLSQQRHIFDDTIDTVAYNTAMTFVDLAGSQDVIAAARRQVTALRDLQSKISQRVQGGLSSTSDLNQANIAIQRAEAEVLTAQTRFDVADGKLTELIGVRPKEVTSLTETQNFVADLGGDGDGDIDHAPSVLAASAATKAAEAKVKIAESGRWPSLSLGASKTSSTTPYNAGDSSFYGLIVNGNFSLGRLVKHKVEAAEAERRAAEQTLENQRLTVRTALGSAETEAEGAAARLTGYQKVIELTRSSRDLYWQEYTLNKRPLTDVINAERDIYQAETERISAVADGVQAKIKVYTAVGQFTILLRDRAVGDEQ